MGIEQLFDGSMNQEPEEVPAIETPPVEAEEPKAEPEPPVDPEPAAEPPKEEEPRHVPLATFLDQRDEAKRYKRELEQAQAELSKRQGQPNEPDPFDDPAGYAAHNKSAIEQSKVETRFEVSDMIARQMHGAETVDTAAEWASEKAKTDRAFALAYMQQPHPIDWIVQQHKRDQLMQQIGDDPDEYVRRRYAELNPTPAPSAAPVAAQQQQAPAPAPPRSLASIPGNGGGGVKEVPVGPMAALEQVFKG